MNHLLSIHKLSIRDFFQRYGGTMVTTGEEYYKLSSREGQVRGGLVEEYLDVHGNLRCHGINLTPVAHAQTLDANLLAYTEQGPIDIPIHRLLVKRPEAVWVNTPVGAVYGCWIPARQWKRGVCTDNTQLFAAYHARFSEEVQKLHPFESSFRMLRWFARKVGNPAIGTFPLEEWTVNKANAKKVCSIALNNPLWCLSQWNISDGYLDESLKDGVFLYYRHHMLGTYSPSKNIVAIYPGCEDFDQEIMEQFPQVEIRPYAYR